LLLLKPKSVNIQLYFIIFYLSFNISCVNTLFLIQIAHIDEPQLGAQLPYPMQPQGMPLPYTLPRTGPSYQPPVYMCAPPMPTTYNPYATLRQYQPQGKLCAKYYIVICN